MTKLAPEWVRTSDPVIRSPARYRWTTAPANNSNEDKYIICVDSLSCLQAIEQQHIDHPLVLDVLEKYSALINKTVLFCWVPSHVGIRENELFYDAAAKAAFWMKHSQS